MRMGVSRDWRGERAVIMEGGVRSTSGQAATVWHAAAIARALSNNGGFGGHTTARVFGRYGG